MKTEKKDKNQEKLCGYQCRGRIRSLSKFLVKKQNSIPYFGFSILLRLPAPKRVHFGTSTERSRPNGRFKKKIAAPVAGFGEKCAFSYFLTDVFQYMNDQQQILIKGPISRPGSRAFSSISMPTLDCQA